MSTADMAGRTTMRGRPAVYHPLRRESDIELILFDVCLAVRSSALFLEEVCPQIKRNRKT